VRAPRLGHVCVDLAAVGDDSTVADDGVPLPPTAAWLAAVRARRRWSMTGMRLRRAR